MNRIEGAESRCAYIIRRISMGRVRKDNDWGLRAMVRDRSFVGMGLCGLVERWEIGIWTL